MKDMLNWKIIALCTSFALRFIFAGINPALAGRTCQGSLGRITIDDTLLVPQNDECTLNGTRVKGSIKLQTNATLKASNVDVDGNIQTIEDNVRKVDVFDNSTVGGSIQIIQSGAADIRDVKIVGDLQLESNKNLLNTERNIIGGNLQAFQNTGGVAVSNNSINGNLQCKENVPVPPGGNNVVDGNMEDQCRNFGGSLPLMPFLYLLF
jgi:hypothetical protein